MLVETNLETILKRWKFPNDIIAKYKSLGIINIFEWQSECLHIEDVLDGGNLVYAAPTSAGKTLVSELLLIRSILNRRRKAIVILPYVSIAKEKLKHLQYLLSDTDINVDGFIGGQAPKGGFESVDIAICTIEKSNSLLNKLIENDAIFELGTIVVDELHMVNDNSRGYLIELILSKIKYLCYKSNKNNQKIQIIGMSATLPNLKTLSEWLKATLYQTNFRPIQLNERIKFESNIYDKDMNLMSKIEIDNRIENDNDLLSHLVLETIKKRNGVLVFCPTKSRCEVIAENIARTIYTLDRNHGDTPTYLDKEKLIDCLNELKATPAGLDSQLAKTIRFGIGFHHAGLTIEEREIIENYFKNGHLLVIVCTSTLSSGVNFPAHRVIIRTPIFNGNKPIDIITYKQMVGRAARNTNGDSILMCNNQNEKKIGIEILNSEIVQIVSQNNNINKQENQDDLIPSIKRSLLEVIVSGIASKKEDIINYFDCKLMTYNREEPAMVNFEKYLTWLNKNQFIDVLKNEISEECYKPTQLGYAVVSSAMAPEEGLIIFNELQKALQCFVLENELHIIYQITPINICDYWINSSCNIDWNLYYSLYQTFKPDVKRVSDLVGVRQSFILKMMKSNTNCDQKLLKIHLRFYTALILNDLVSEVPFSNILNKYACQKGFLQSLQQSSSSYAYMISTFCNRLSWFNLEILISQFQTRLIFGVQKQLVDLVRISLLNSHRARAFYNAGYTNVASIAMCDLKTVERILRSSMMFIGSGDNKPINDQPNKINSETVIWNDGKNYTYYQASNRIIQEASDILKSDLESLGIKIKSDQLDTTNINSKTTNKSMFEFNDTISVDSVIQVHSKNVTGLELEIDKIDERIEQNKTCFMQEVILEEKKEIIKSESLSDSKCDSKCDSKILIKPDDIENQLTGPKSEEINNETPLENKIISNSQISSSFLDDQCILEAAVYFEKDLSKNNNCGKNDNSVANEINNSNNNKIDKVINEENKNVTNSTSKKPNLNTTIVSEDVLQLCNIFEKNVSSGKKSIEPKKFENKPKENENNIVKRKLNYSFGEQTLKDILNSSIYNTQKSDEPITKNDYKEESNNMRSQLINHIDNLSCSIKFKINVIENLNEFESFINSIKPKCTLSLSIACDYLNEKPPINENFFIYNDEKHQRFIKFYGISIFLESCDKKIEFYFLMLNENKTFEIFIKNILERDDINKILFYTKNHYKIINRAFGINVTMPLYDPIIANWLLNQEICSIFQIKQKYCANINIIMDNELKQSKYCYGCSNYLSYKASGSSLNTYQRSFIESLIGFYCFDKIKLQLQLQNLWNYYVKIEAEILIICANVEINGFRLNFDELECIKNKLVKKKKDIENKINSFAGHEVNLNSTDQVASIIYDKLKLKPLVDQNKMNGNKFKHHSTSKDILNQLANQHEVPRLIILWRKITHTLSNSIYPVERCKVYDKSQNIYKIYSKIDLFNVTGRMNFIEPSMQNIPRDFDISTDKVSEINSDSNEISNLNKNDQIDEEYQFLFDKINDDDTNKDQIQHKSSLSSISIRNVFIAGENKTLLSADYSNLEFRIMANLCKDESLITIFNDSKIDVFVALASKWLNLEPKNIDEEKRQNVKKIIYSIIYGISPKTLSILLNLTEKEAANFIDSFKSTFPGLKKYISNQLEFCKQKGYIETIRKRKRFFPNMASEDIKIRAQAERQAINTLVQGSASDLVKSSMVKIDKTISKKFKTKSGTTYMPAKLVLQMHDELIYEVNEKYLKEIQNIVKDCMENCMELPVKMKVKMKIGKTWGTLTNVC